MSVVKITAALDSFAGAKAEADSAVGVAKDSLREVLVAFGTTSVGNKALATKLDAGRLSLLGGKSSQYIGNVKRIGAQVKAGRVIVDVYDPKVLAKVSGKAQNGKAWDAYMAGLEGASVTLSALAEADDLESATTKKAAQDWDPAKAIANLIAKADKEGVSREALARMFAEANTKPELVLVPGEAA